MKIEVKLKQHIGKPLVHQLAVGFFFFFLECYKILTPK
jgi:hypothetical protein